MINKKNILAYLMVLSFAATSAAERKENKIFDGNDLITNIPAQNDLLEKDISLIYEMDTEDAANKLEKAIGNEVFYKLATTNGFMYILKEKDYQGDKDNKEYLQHSVQDVQKRINEVLDKNDSWRKTNYYVKIKNPSKQFRNNKVFGEGGKKFKQEGKGISDSIDIIIEKKGSLGLSKVQWSLVLLAVIVAGGVAAYMGGMFNEKTEKENNGGGVAETTEKAK